MNEARGESPVGEPLLMKGCGKLTERDREFDRLFMVDGARAGGIGEGRAGVGLRCGVGSPQPSSVCCRS